MGKTTTLQGWLDETNTKMDALGAEVGCSGVHIGRLAKGDPRCSLKLAVRILEKTGVAVGPLANKTPGQIKTLSSAQQLLSGAA